MAKWESEGQGAELAVCVSVFHSGNTDSCLHEMCRDTAGRHLKRRHSQAGTFNGSLTT